VHADVAQVGAECRLNLASNVGGQRSAAGLSQNGVVCHRAVVVCGCLRRSNRQIHRQRALSYGTGTGIATRTTYRSHISLAPLGSIPTHSVTIPPGPGTIYRGTGVCCPTTASQPPAGHHRNVGAIGGTVSRTGAYTHEQSLTTALAIRPAASCTPSRTYAEFTPD
jgi:hypothetical protein